MKQISYIAIVLVISIAFFLGWKHAKTISENERLKHNLLELSIEKKDLATTLTVKDRELKTLIQERFPILERKLDSLKIRSNTIEKIVVQEIIYRDTTTRSTDLQPVLDAIQKKVKIVSPFVDTTPCLTIVGQVEFNGETLNLSITDRKFTSIAEAVSHWERKQWKFWFIKSRLFGKKELKVTVFNNCGESKTIVVNKK